MPSKPFYSIEEVSARLGKSTDEIKELVREGLLREFRDAGKVFFKAEDVEKLGGPSAAEDESSSPPADDTGEIMLESPESSDEDDVGTLSSSTGGTSIIGLEPLEDEESSSEPAEKEQQKKKKEDTVITASGIGVFDDDELEIDADPMAKTQITEGAMDDQVSLEGAGSGSGLLDLAREADDTALGADLLDEIYPGEEQPEEPAAAEAETEEPEVAEPAEEAPAEAEEAPLEEAPVAAAPTPRVVAAADPMEGMLTGLLVGPLVVMALACMVVAGVLQGFVPGFTNLLIDGMNFYFFLGGAVVLAALTLLVGWFIGKASAPSKR